MALDSRMILEGIQPAIEAARPVTNLLQGLQSGQQLERNALENQLLQQRADLAPLQQQALEQDLAKGDIQNQMLQANLDALGVPDVPTAKEVALSVATIAGLPTPEAKLAKIQTLKKNAIASGRTTANLDELESAYMRSPETGDQLLNAGIGAFEKAGFLTPDQRQSEAPFQRAEGGMVFDPNTGTFSVDPTAKSRLDEIARQKEANGTTLDAKDRQSISKDITGMIKDTVGIRNTAQDLDRLGKIGGGPSAIAMVYKFMKSLDPASVVREGEFATAESASGVPTQIANIYNKLVSGERLDKTQVDSFVKTAKELANSAIESSSSEVDKYLGTFEDSIPDSFIKKTKERIPSMFDIDSSTASTSGPKQLRLEELRKRTGL